MQLTLRVVVLVLLLYLCNMTLNSLDVLMYENKALAVVSGDYTGIKVGHVEMLRFVSWASRGTGSCYITGVMLFMASVGKGLSVVQVQQRLNQLLGYGLVNRQMKGLRMRYTVTVQGINLLYAMDKALRKVRKYK